MTDSETSPFTKLAHIESLYTKKLAYIRLYNKVGLYKGFYYKLGLYSTMDFITKLACILYMSICYKVGLSMRL